MELNTLGKGTVINSYRMNWGGWPDIIYDQVFGRGEKPNAHYQGHSFALHLI